MVCLDRSRLAEQAIPYAVAQARQFGSTLVLANVCQPDFASYAIPAASPLGVFPVDLIMREFTQRWQEAGQYLGKIAERLVKESFAVEPVVLRGTWGVAESIADYAEQHGIDLITMAGHGRTGLKRLLLGSTSHAVARLTRIPVLLVTPVTVPDGETTDDAPADDEMDFAFG